MERSPECRRFRGRCSQDGVQLGYSDDEAAAIDSLDVSVAIWVLLRTRNVSKKVLVKSSTHSSQSSGIVLSTANLRSMRALVTMRCYVVQ